MSSYSWWTIVWKSRCITCRTPVFISGLRGFPGYWKEINVSICTNKSKWSDCPIIEPCIVWHKIPVGASDDKDEEDAEEVEGWTLDDDEEGDGGASIFKFKGKYLELWLGGLVWLDIPPSTFFSGEVFLLDDNVDIPTSSDVSDPVELEHFCSFSFIISSLTTIIYRYTISPIFNKNKWFE